MKHTSTIELHGPIKLKYFEQDFLIEVSTTYKIMFNLCCCPIIMITCMYFIKMHGFLSVNVFGMKVLIIITKMGTFFCMSPTGNWTAILGGYLSHRLRCMQREYLHFSVILRPVLVLPWQSNPWPRSCSAVKCSTNWAYLLILCSWFLGVVRPIKTG